MMHIVDRLLACAAIAAIAGCASAPPTRYYTLSADNVQPAPPTSLSVSVGPVAVSALLDRPQIVLSVGPNQVVLDEFNRWASPLQDNVGRVVAENLVAMLGTQQVTTFPQSQGTDAQYRVAIDIQSLDSMPGKASRLDAVWTVQRTGDSRVTTKRTTVVENVQATGDAALIAAHSRALGQLSRDIADALLTMSNTSRPLGSAAGASTLEPASTK
jgi:uncharacterized protein